MTVKAPPPLPSMWEARNLVLKDEIPELAWPCIKCWGEGCKACDGVGAGTRAAFAAWYARLHAERKQQLEAYNRELDLDAQDIVGENFYDLERLRKMGSRGS